MYYFSKIQKISRIVGAMKRYIVGGWVRDTLLKEEGFDIAPQDKDWVVVPVPVRKKWLSVVLFP